MQRTTDVPPRPWTMAQIKRLAVLDAIERHGGSKPAAAAELGISLKSVYNILAGEPETEISVRIAGGDELSPAIETQNLKGET
jgi:hypothetical protein